MEIKIDINGSDTELATFLHGFTINHSHEVRTAVKTANTKKKGRPKKTVKADSEPDPTDDTMDDPEMADIRDYIFEDGD